MSNMAYFEIIGYLIIHHKTSYVKGELGEEQIMGLYVSS